MRGHACSKTAAGMVPFVLVALLLTIGPATPSYGVRPGAGLLSAATAGALTSGNGTPQWDDPWDVPGPMVFFDCRISHRSNDDPIVFPGRRNATHRHVFYGNRSADARSTTATLRQARTSCGDRRNTAAYWFPEPRLGSGRPAPLWGPRTYYQKAGLRRVQPIPTGLRMLAGSLDTRTFHTGETGFVCRSRTSPGRNGMPRGGRGATRCPGRSRLGFAVVFPNCWDGRNLDSPDHRSHLRYARDGRCARGWTPIPQVRISVTSADGRWGGRFSSGDPRSVHADVIATARPALMRRITRCLNTGRACPNGNRFGE